MAKKVKATQLCPTHCDHMDYLGILQARILEWVALSFSRGSSRPRTTEKLTTANLCTQNGPQDEGDLE